MIPRQVLAAIIFIVTLFTVSASFAEDAATVHSDSNEQPIRIASKTFTESHVLAELAAQLLEAHGYTVERKLGLGGTMIAYQALKEGAIDLYPEYTGTLTQAILKQPGLSDIELAAALKQQQLQLATSFGFNNSYAIAISQTLAEENNIRAVSELIDFPQLRFGFSLEFLNRADGWPALQEFYQLPQGARGLEHALAYNAVESGQLDVTDAYTTDGELEAFDLRLLKDDKQFFPLYYAGLLARDDLPKEVVEQLSRFEKLIDEPTMRALNARVSNEKLSPKQVAREFLNEQGLVKISSSANTIEDSSTSVMAQRILHNTLVHLKLTSIALLLACLFAIPMALLLFQHQRIARTLLYFTGLIQTIPSLALLAFMIPFFGLGELPAIVALFLYSLLPIIRNTLTGIFGVDPLLKQMATGMGLTPAQQLRKIELPLAVPMILAGIKTAAIISIGTATLAAFVGAGGLGEPIITGLTLNDHRLILEGAIPAALLAIAAELLFEGLERFVVPKHLLAK